MLASSPRIASARIAPSTTNDNEGRPPEAGSEGPVPVRIQERYELADKLILRCRGTGRTENGVKSLMDGTALERRECHVEVSSQRAPTGQQ